MSKLIENLSNPVMLGETVRQIRESYWLCDSFQALDSRTKNYGIWKGYLCGQGGSIRSRNDTTSKYGGPD